MIIDADTHITPSDIFDGVPYPAFQSLYRDLIRPADFERNWRLYYESISGTNWPACPRIRDFAELPEEIRRAIHRAPGPGHIRVSEDLNEVYVDDPSNGLPDTDAWAKNIRGLVGVDHALVNPDRRYMYLHYFHDNDLARHLMWAWNRGALKIHARHPHLDVNAWLSLQDIAASIKELEFIADNDFFGVFLADDIPWSFIPEFGEIFRFCAAHRIPIYLHRSAISYPNYQWFGRIDRNDAYERLRDHYRFDYFWEVNLAGLVANGILDQHPDLRIVVAERDINWISSMRDFMTTGGMPDPLPYFQRNVWFTTEIESPSLLPDADIIGWDRLLFATDYPHNDPGGSHRFKDVAVLRGLLDRGMITQKQFDQISHENYIKLRDRV